LDENFFEFSKGRTICEYNEDRDDDDDAVMLQVDNVPVDTVAPVVRVESEDLLEDVFIFGEDAPEEGADTGDEPSLCWSRKFLFEGDFLGEEGDD
jgi:hypothetical protein